MVLIDSIYVWTKLIRKIRLNKKYNEGNETKLQVKSWSIYFLNKTHEKMNEMIEFKTETKQKSYTEIISF